MNAAPSKSVADQRYAFWTKRARAYLDEVDVEGGDDAFIALSAATECLHIAHGEHPIEPDLNGYDSLPDCTCPPDLVERGGWRSGCPRHHG